MKKLYRLVSRLTPLDITRVLLLDLISVEPVDAEVQQTRLRCSALSAAQLEKWVPDDSNDLNQQAASSIDDDATVCVGAFINENLAGYIFFCRSPVEPEKNSGGSKFTGIGLEFPLQVRYLYKAFVLPEYRGKGVANSILHSAINRFKADGVTHIVTTTDWTNSSFLQAVSKVGFVHTGVAAEWVVGSWHGYRIPVAVNIRSNRAQKNLPGNPASQQIHLLKPSKPTQSSA